LPVSISKPFTFESKLQRDLTKNPIQCAVSCDLEQHIVAIGDYIDRDNQNPRPFIWTAKASDILQGFARPHRTQ